MDPGLLAAPFGHGRNTSILLQLIGRGVAVALFAEGDEETRSKDRASAWEGVKEREVRMALGALCDGFVELFDRVQGRSELGDESLGQERIGGDHTLIGGQWDGTLNGVDALVDDVRIAHMVVAEEALQGGASCQLHGLQRRPLSEKVAEDEGVFVVEPLQGMRKVVFEGTGEPICEAHFVTNEAAARGHELFEGAHGGTLGLQGLELITMFEQE